MTEHTNISPRPSLFARKGEAEPAPAVAYVSLRQMQGKPDRREVATDRRAQWGDGQDNQKTADNSASQRRVFTANGNDHDGRRHFTPRSGLAMGQQYVPWTTPQSEAGAPAQPAKARNTSPSVSSLSSLISRHRDGVSKSPAKTPEPAPAVLDTTDSPAPDHSAATRHQPAHQTAAVPTRIDMSYLSASAGRDQRPASSKPTASPYAPHVKQPPAPYKRKILRRKVTIRIEVKQFNKIKSLANKPGKSQQSIMAAAVAYYLNTID